MQYKDWIKDWLVNYKEATIKRRTYLFYERAVENHIIPAFGHYNLCELSSALIQNKMIDLLKNGNLKTGQGLSVNSVNVIVHIVQDSLKTAYEAGLIGENFEEKIKRPKQKEKEISCFTIAEQRRIERAIGRSGKAKLVGILICLYTGLRIGELLALEWKDVDLKKRVLSVSKTCYDGSDEDRKTVRITDTPKTALSNRLVPIPKQLLPFLLELKRKSRSSLVISNGKCGISVRSYQKSFEVLLRDIKVPHKGFHALRHTFATRAIECGMDVKTLSEILGHKSPVITLNRYAHSMNEHKKEMMNKVGKSLKYGCVN